MLISSMHKREPVRGRRGAAAVEMAVLSFFFAIITIGTLEIGTAFLLRENLTDAARQGCRQAIHGKGNT